MTVRRLLLAALVGLSLTACGGGGGGESGDAVALGVSGAPSGSLDLSGAPRAAPPSMGALET
jgi:hypothetical protein